MGGGSTAGRPGNGQAEGPGKVDRRGLQHPSPKRVSRSIQKIASELLVITKLKVRLRMLIAVNQDFQGAWTGIAHQEIGQRRFRSL